MIVGLWGLFDAGRAELLEYSRTAFDGLGRIA